MTEKKPSEITHHELHTDILLLKKGFETFVEHEKERRETDSIPNGKERMESQESIVQKLQRHMWTVSAVGTMAIIFVPIFLKVLVP